MGTKIDLDSRRKIVILFIVIIIFFLLHYCQNISNIKLTSISPDGRWKVEFIDHDRFNRNFEIILKDLKNSEQEKKIYSSQDVPHKTTERFIWSKDSSKLLLVGTGFKFEGKDYRLRNNEGLYLLYDTQTGNIWCNCSNGMKNYSLSDISNIDFGEPLIGQPQTPLTK